MAVLGRDEALARIRDQAGLISAERADHSVPSQSSAASLARGAMLRCENSVQVSIVAKTAGRPTSGITTKNAHRGRCLNLTPGSLGVPANHSRSRYHRETRHERSGKAGRAAEEVDRRADARRQDDEDAGAQRHDRARRDRRRQALPRHRLLHLRSGLHLDRQLRRRASPTSTATRASCSIAATRSTSWPRTSNFLEICYLLLHGELPTNGEFDQLPHAPSRATRWCTSR